MIRFSAPSLRQAHAGQALARTVRAAAVGVLAAALLAVLPNGAAAQGSYSAQSARNGGAAAQRPSAARSAHAAGAAAQRQSGDTQADPCLTPDGRPLPPITLQPGQPQVICPGQAVLLPPGMTQPVVVSPQDWEPRTMLPEDDRIRPDDIIGRIPQQLGPFAKPVRPDITPDTIIGRVTEPREEPSPESPEDKARKFLLARPKGFAGLPWKTHADVAKPLDFRRVGKPGAVTFYTLPEERVPSIAGMRPAEVVFGFVGLRLGWGAVKLHDARQLDLITRTFTQTYGEPSAYGQTNEENVWEWKDVTVRALHSQRLGVPLVIYEYSPLTSAFRSELDPLLGVEDIWTADAEPITKPQPRHVDERSLQERRLRADALASRQRELLTGMGQGGAVWSGLDRTGTVPGLAVQPGASGASRLPGQFGSGN